MARGTHTEQPLRPRTTTPGWSVSLFPGVLALVVSCTLAVSQAQPLGPPASPPPRSPSGDVMCLAAEAPRTVLEHAGTWQREARHG